MNLSIVLNDFIGINGILKTYRFIPINEWNRVVVDRISDIHLDVKGNSDQDIGLLRIYNSNKCELSTTKCKIKAFSSLENSHRFKFSFEHMGVPVETSESGSGGIYNLILPISYKFTSLHIVDPFDQRKLPIEETKHFEYTIYFDREKEMQIVQMQLRSRRGSFSFVVHGEAEKYQEGSTNYISSTESEINLDEDIKDFFFDEHIKKSFWRHLKESIQLEPNFYGIGIDVKKLFAK